MHNRAPSHAPSVLRAVLLSLAKSGAVGVATLLGFLIAVEVGTLVSFVGSFLLLLGSYRREWKLSWVSALLPAVSAALCFLLQLALFEGSCAAALLMLPVMAGGVVLGIVRGKAHHVYRKADRIYAQRTVLYLAIWAGCFAVTQLFGLLKAKGLVVFGLLSGAFSTAMLVSVAILLLRRYRALRTAVAAVALALAGPAAFFEPAAALAQDDCESSSDDDCETASATTSGSRSEDNAAETAAGIGAGVIMLVAGTWINIVSSVATATAATVAVEEPDSDDRPAEPPAEPPATTHPHLRNPDDGTPLVVNDGTWPGVPAGHVWYGEWTDPQTAQKWISQREAEIRAIQAQSDAAWERTQAESERRSGASDADLRDQGFVFDRESQTWKPGPDHPESLQKDRLAAIRRQIDALGKVQDRLPMDEWSTVDTLGDTLIAAGGSDEDVLGRLQRLTGAVYTKAQGSSMREEATAALDAAWAKFGEDAARNVQIGAAAAGLVAGFAPGAAAAGVQLGAFTLGSNFVQGAAEGFVEGGLGAAVYEGTRAVLPVNTLISIAQGEGAGRTALSTLRDLGSVIGLRDAAKNVAALGRANRGLGRLDDLAGGADDLSKAAPRGTHAAPSPEQIDAAWHAARRDGQRLVDEFTDLHSRLKGAAGAERAALEKALRDKAVEINSSYSAKAILKPHRNEITGALDDQIVKVYKETDHRTVDALTELGVRRGGRAFTPDDLVDLRNASSAGTVGMDRDVALNEMLQRRLLDRMNAARAGTPEGQAMGRALDELRRGAMDGPNLKQFEATLREGMERAAAAGDTVRVDALKRELGDLALGRQLGRPQLSADADRVVAFLEKQRGAVRAGSREETELLAEIADWKKWRGGSADPTRPISTSAWNRLTQRVYGEQYRGVTGRDADQAYQALTQGKNAEAYYDLNVLANKPDRIPFKKEWAGQTASVTSYKTYHNAHLAHRGLITHGEAIQETARGMAKDMDTKLIPLLNASRGVPAERLESLVKIRNVLDKVGKGAVAPGQADRLLREAVPHIPDMNLDKAVGLVTSNLEAAVKFHVPKVGG